MAGDWIKMRVDLHDDPSVIAISVALGLDEFAVVGRLHRLWAWADQQTVDGNALGVTGAWLDRYIGVTGFAEAMANAGWLTETDVGLSIPNYDHHNGQTGKQRALSSKRTAKSRAKCNGVGNGPSVTGALPREEKRREEKNTKKPPLPPEGDCAPDSKSLELERAEEIYAAYPRKEARGAALKAITKALGVVDFDVLLEAVKEYSSLRKRPGNEERLTPHPATWFNSRRWEDDRANWRRLDNEPIGTRQSVTAETSGGVAFLRRKQDEELRGVRGLPFEDGTGDRQDDAG